jgi:hypothetical protein
MKLLHKNAKITSLLLAIIFLFQGCHAYKSTPISLDEASRTNSRVKIITTENKRIVFRKIEKTDLSYYGFKKEKEKIIRVLLNEKDIRKIKAENKTLSTILTITGITFAVATIVLIILIIDTLNDLDNLDLSSDEAN